MPKITSPVKRWPGTVTLPDYLTWPQMRIWKTAADEASQAADLVEQRLAWVRGICQIVMAWELAGLPETLSPETFPATPPRSGVALMGWLIDGISALLDEADEAPNV